MEQPQTLLRVLKPSDYEQFYALRAAALESSPQSYGNHIDVWRAAEKHQVVALLESSASPEDGCILGAFMDDGALVGMVGLRRESKQNVVHKATMWGFFVRSEVRRQGIGTALVEEALATAKSYEGLRHVRLIVTVGDNAAQRVFQACGFVEYGVEKEGICSEGRLLDQSFMFKPLT